MEVGGIGCRSFRQNERRALRRNLLLRFAAEDPPACRRVAARLRRWRGIGRRGGPQASITALT